MAPAGRAADRGSSAVKVLSGLFGGLVLSKAGRVCTKAGKLVFSVIWQKLVDRG